MEVKIMKVFLNEPIHKDAYQLLNDNFDIIDDLSYIQDADIIITRNLQLDKNILNILQMEQFNHRCEVTRGVLEDDCSNMLTTFFKELRQEKERKRG